MVIIAELGCNHMGDVNLAKQSIEVAASFCQVDRIKFQKRTVKELLTETEYNAPHPNLTHAYGQTYGAHREFLEFSIEEHQTLKIFCEEKGIEYASSVWDITAAKEIASLEPLSIKIPSASNNNMPLLQWVLEHFKGSIHISLGMTTKEEEVALVALIKRYNRMADIVLYACTSAYPVAVEDLHLLEIKRLCHTYGDEILGIGFSGHHNGIAMDVAAMTLGVSYVERHFTLDRTWKGTDHAASLEPDGMRRLKRDSKALQKALTYKESEILAVEEPARKKLKWRG